MRKFALTALSFVLIFTLSAQTKKTTSPAKPKTTTAATGRLVEIKTDYGTMIFKLYDSTPLHRTTLFKLVKEKFYDSLLFHRVIQIL
jgi:peptidyl-prolyl cis-trans isomerase B (cyclophilin B)